MSAFLWILRRECRDQIVTRRFQWGLTICILLSVLTAFVRSTRYIEAHTESQEFAQRWRNSLGEQLQRDESLEVASMRSLSPLATLSLGLESITPFRFYSTKEGLRLGESRSSHDPVDALFGHLDLALVVQMIMSLLTIALGFDAICGERKQGTLSMLLSYPVSRAAVLLAKLTGTAIVAACICCLGIAVAATTQSLVGAPLGNISHWLAFAGLSVIFLSVVAAMTIGVSVVSREPANAVVLALALWATTVILIPRIAAVIINAVIPPSTAVERSLRLDTAISALRVEHARELHRSYERYLETSSTANRDGVLRSEVAESTQRLSIARRRLVDRMLEQSFREEEERDALVRLLGSLSPASLFAESASELALTGRLQRRHFQKQARLYDDEIGRRLVESRHVMHSDQPLGAGGAGSALVLVDSVRPFMIPYRTSWLGGTAIAGAVIPNTLILVALLMAIALLAYRAFLRLDVRP